MKIFKLSAVLENYLLRRYEITDKNKVSLFNFIKANNLTVRLYHGSSEIIYKKIQERGYLLSPFVMGTSDKEARARDNVSQEAMRNDPKARVSGTDQIFLTTSIEQANDYALRTSHQISTEFNKEDPPVIFALDIPVYIIQEIMVPLLNNQQMDKIYNEFNLAEEFHQNLLDDKDENGKVSKKYQGRDGLLNKIKFFLDAYIGQYSEFTIQLALSKRFIKEVFHKDDIEKVMRKDVTRKAVAYCYHNFPVPTNPAISLISVDDITFDNFPKEWLDKITASFINYNDIPNALNSFCRYKINSDTCPKEWMDIFYAKIANNGTIPAFTFDFFYEKMKNPSKELTDAVSKCVAKNGYPPSFAESWCALQLKNDIYPKEWLEGLKRAFVTHGYVFHFAKNWFREKMETNTVPDELMQFIYTLISEGKYSSQMRVFLQQVLNSNNPPPELIESITNHISFKLTCPDFAEPWCKNRMNSGDFPAEWLEATYKAIKTIGEPPDFADKWCQSMIRAVNPPQGLIDAVLDLVTRSNGKVIPVFARDWYKANYRKDSKKAYNIKQYICSSNWYLNYKVS